MSALKMKQVTFRETSDNDYSLQHFRAFYSFPTNNGKAFFNKSDFAMENFWDFHHICEKDILTNAV